MLWSILRPPCILWVFNLYVFADAIRPGSHPARLLTQQLTPHVSIYDSSLVAAQNQPFVSVENVSFLFRKRVREREGESERDMGDAGSRDSVKSLNEIYASRRVVTVFTARRADGALPLVWHNRDDDIRQYLCKVARWAYSGEWPFYLIHIITTDWCSWSWCSCCHEQSSNQVLIDLLCPKLRTLLALQVGRPWLWAVVPSCPFWPLTSDTKKEILVHICHWLNIWLLGQGDPRLASLPGSSSPCQIRVT